MSASPTPLGRPGCQDRLRFLWPTREEEHSHVNRAGDDRRPGHEDQYEEDSDVDVGSSCYHRPEKSCELTSSSLP